MLLCLKPDRTGSLLQELFELSQMIFIKISFLWRGRKNFQTQLRTYWLLIDNRAKKQKNKFCIENFGKQSLFCNGKSLPRQRIQWVEKNSLIAIVWINSWPLSISISFPPVSFSCRECHKRQNWSLSSNRKTTLIEGGSCVCCVNVTKREVLRFKSRGVHAQPDKFVLKKRYKAN